MIYTSKTQLAKQYNKSRATIYSWIKRGKVTTLTGKNGKRYYVHVVDMIKHLTQHLEKDIQ